jgi:hypothetical protein
MTARELPDNVVSLQNQRDAIADQRDEIAERRDAVAAERDDASASRELKVDAIMAAAEIRDARAAARDFDADQRDQADLLFAIVHDVDDARASQARGTAGTDRVHAKSDRTVSGVDRSLLADFGFTAADRAAALKRAMAATVERVEAANSRDRAAKRRRRLGRKPNGTTSDDHRQL